MLTPSATVAQTYPIHLSPPLLNSPWLLYHGAAHQESLPTRGPASPCPILIPIPSSSTNQDLILDPAEEGSVIGYFCLVLALLGLVWSLFGSMLMYLGLLVGQLTPFLVPLPQLLLLWHVSVRFWPVQTILEMCRVVKMAQSGPKMGQKYCWQPKWSLGITGHVYFWLSFSSCYWFHNSSTAKVSGGVKKAQVNVKMS